VTSIVKELSDWTNANAEELLRRGVQVIEKLPEPNSTHPWKAGIGLVHRDLLASFTVWELTIFQTELIIMNAKTGATLVVEDKTPSDAAHIRADLEALVERLLRN
jgi:hypothetical protein